MAAPTGNALTTAAPSRRLVGAGLFCLIAVAGLHGQAQADGPSSEILDEIRLPAQDGNGNPISQISGLAWDRDEQTLYAVSDLGHIVVMDVTITADTISALTMTGFHDVALAAGPKDQSDAEGLVVLNAENGIRGDSLLAIVMEDGPSAAIFDPSGRLVDRIDLPDTLATAKAYRRSNKGLEAIGHSATLGYVFLPQSPLDGEAAETQRAYFGDGRQAEFPRAGRAGSYIKDAQMMPDGSMMLLEGYIPGGITSWIGLSGPVMRLRRVDLPGCDGPDLCAVKDYPPRDPGAMQDRFEGMTRIDDDRFLVATDEDSGARLALLRISE